MANNGSPDNFNKNIFTGKLSVKDSGIKAKVNTTSFTDANGNTIGSSNRNLVVVNEKGKEKYSSLRKADSVVANEKAFRLNNMSTGGKALYHTKESLKNAGRASKNAVKNVAKRKINSSLDKAVAMPTREIGNQMHGKDAEFVDISGTASRGAKELQYRLNRKVGNAYKRHRANNRLKRNTTKVTVDDAGNVLKIEEKKRFHTQKTKFNAEDHININKDQNVELSKKSQKKHDKASNKQSKKLQKKKNKKAMIEKNKHSKNPIKKAGAVARDGIGRVGGAVKSIAKIIIGVVMSILSTVLTIIVSAFGAVAWMIPILLLFMVPLFALVGGTGASEMGLRSYSTDDEVIVNVENAYVEKEANIAGWASDKINQYKTDNALIDTETEEYRFNQPKFPALGHNPYALASFFTGKYGIDNGDLSYTFAQAQADFEMLFNMQYTIEFVELPIKTETKQVPGQPVETVGAYGTITIQETTTDIDVIIHTYDIIVTNHNLVPICSSLLSGDNLEIYKATLSMYGNKEYLFGNVYNMPLDQDENGNYLNWDGSILVNPPQYGDHGYTGSAGNLSAPNSAWAEIDAYAHSVNYETSNQCTTFTAYAFHQLYPDLIPPVANGKDWVEQLCAKYPDLFELSDVPAPGAVFSAGPATWDGGKPQGHVGIITAFDGTNVTFSDGSDRATQLGSLSNGNMHINSTIDLDTFEAYWVKNHSWVSYAVPKK